jgi:hypothetical protein
MLDLKNNPTKSTAKSRVMGVPKERRQEPRYSVAAMADATELRSQTRVSGRISDIGMGGCYFEAMSPFAVGADLRVRITRSEQTFVANAKVLYSTGGMGMGLLFSQMEPDQREVLRRWVGELSGSGVEPLAPVAASVGAETPTAEVAPTTGSGHELEREPEAAAAAGKANDEQRNVLNELIITLIRKRVLTDAEGKALMRRLLG